MYAIRCVWKDNERRLDVGHGVCSFATDLEPFFETDAPQAIALCILPDTCSKERQRIGWIAVLESFGYPFEPCCCLHRRSHHFQIPHLGTDRTPHKFLSGVAVGPGVGSARNRDLALLQTGKLHVSICLSLLNSFSTVCQ